MPGRTRGTSRKPEALQLVHRGRGGGVGRKPQTLPPGETAAGAPARRSVGCGVPSQRRIAGGSDCAACQISGSALQVCWACDLQRQHPRRHQRLRSPAVVAARKSLIAAKWQGGSWSCDPAQFSASAAPERGRSSLYGPARHKNCRRVCRRWLWQRRALFGVMVFNFCFYAIFFVVASFFFFCNFCFLSLLPKKKEEEKEDKRWEGTRKERVVLGSKPDQKQNNRSPRTKHSK